MRIAAVQMNSTSDKSKNLSNAYSYLKEAIDRGTDLIAFPENFSFFTDDSEEFLEEAETLKGLTVETLREWAADYGVWILGGSIPLKSKKDSKKVTNTSLLISDEGDIHARYDKIHLFDVALDNGVQPPQLYEESKRVISGSKIVTSETPWSKIGLSICYDIRFPEIYREQSAQGAELLFIPSAFTQTTGKVHWDVLTRSRAIENLSYVIAPAQVGSPFPGRTTYGHTRIVDPWGRILAERSKGPGIVWAPIHFEKLTEIRKNFPALDHRKFMIKI